MKIFGRRMGKKKKRKRVGVDFIQFNITHQFKSSAFLFIILHFVLLTAVLYDNMCKQDVLLQNFLNLKINFFLILINRVGGSVKVKIKFLPPNF